MKAPNFLSGLNIYTQRLNILQQRAGHLFTTTEESARPGLHYIQTYFTFKHAVGRTDAHNVMDLPCQMLEYSPLRFHSTCPQT